MIRRRLALGIWSERLSCLKLHPAAPVSPLEDAWGLTLAAARGAIVSGRTALQLRRARLSGIGALPLLVLTSSRTRTDIPGARVEVALPRSAPGKLHFGFGGLRVASAADAILDLIPRLSRSEAGDLVDEGMQLRLLDVDFLSRAVDARACSGRRGSQVLRWLLRRAKGGGESAAERLMARLLKRASLQGWRTGFPVRDQRTGAICARLDFAHEALGIAIEVDGRAAHSGDHSFERDRSRQNLVSLEDWFILRFTWRRLKDDPTGVIDEVRRAMILRSHRALARSAS